MRWRLKSPASPLFTQPFIPAYIKANIKAPRHWPLCGEFTRDRLIPHTNGQLRGKCFHLMTSSCVHPGDINKRSFSFGKLIPDNLNLALRPRPGTIEQFARATHLLFSWKSGLVAMDQTDGSNKMQLIWYVQGIASDLGISCRFSNHNINKLKCGAVIKQSQFPSQYSQQKPAWL